MNGSIVFDEAVKGVVVLCLDFGKGSKSVPLGTEDIAHLRVVILNKVYEVGGCSVKRCLFIPATIWVRDCVDFVDACRVAGIECSLHVSVGCTLGCPVFFELLELRVGISDGCVLYFRFDVEFLLQRTHGGKDRLELVLVVGTRGLPSSAEDGASLFVFNKVDSARCLELGGSGGSGDGTGVSDCGCGRRGQELEFFELQRVLLGFHTEGKQDVGNVRLKVGWRNACEPIACKPANTQAFDKELRIVAVLRCAINNAFNGKRCAEREFPTEPIFDVVLNILEATTTTALRQDAHKLLDVELLVKVVGFVAERVVSQSCGHTWGTQGVNGNLGIEFVVVAFSEKLASGSVQVDWQEPVHRFRSNKRRSRALALACTPVAVACTVEQLLGHLDEGSAVGVDLHRFLHALG